MRAFFVTQVDVHSDSADDNTDDPQPDAEFVVSDNSGSVPNSLRRLYHQSERLSAMLEEYHMDEGLMNAVGQMAAQLSAGTHTHSYATVFVYDVSE